MILEDTSNDELQFHEYLDLLKMLIREPSVVGAEEPFFRVLQRELESRGARVDRYQGLLVAEGNDPESVQISAHVDRHGLLSTGPGEFQYAAFIARNRGDLTGDSVSEQTFLTISNRFSGERVHAYDPWSGGYLGQAEIIGTSLCPRRGNLVFQMDGLQDLIPGSPAGFLDRLDLENGYLRGQLDNVLGVAALVHLFDLGFQGRAFFSAQEEAGRSWRFLLDWFQREDRACSSLWVIDTSPFANQEDADAQDIVLRTRDANGAFNPECVRKLAHACESLGIRTIFKDQFIEKLNEERVARGESTMSIGRTELGRLAIASEGTINGATIQVPTTGYHTRQETARAEAVRALLRLLKDCTENA